MALDNYWSSGNSSYMLLPKNEKSIKRNLMITLSDGICLVESYMDIGRMECNSTGQLLTLHIKGGKPINFIGQNFHKLLLGLQQEIISHLYRFDEHTDSLPTPENEQPIITDIFEGIPDTIDTEVVANQN